VVRKYIFKYGMPDGSTGCEEVNVTMDMLDTMLIKYTDCYERGIITWWDYEEMVT